MTIIGTSGNDNLTGTAGDDTIEALGGSDWVVAGPGNDVVHGGDGNDYLQGGDGSDTLYGESDNDSFDSLGVGDAQNDIADGGSGNDTFRAFWVGDPTITTGTGSDTIELGGGSDGHRVTVTDFTTGTGGDVLDISWLVSSLSGWDGSTNPFAAGFLRLVQNGTDTDLQRDQNGGTGGTVWTTVVTLQNVSASSLTVANFAPGYPPEGSLPLGQTIIGTSGNDNLTGTAGDDTIEALGGSDWVVAGPGNDVVHGGDGNDYLQGGDGSDTLYGESDNDSFDSLGVGDAQNDIADGGSGNDTFRAFWVGDPTITTGTGSDTIELGGGSDGHRVTVTDFTTGTGGDVLDISWLVSSLSGWDGSTNPFAAGFLRLVQNGTDTDLQRDQNGGTGGTVWTTVVTLQNVSASSLTVANFAPGYPPEGSLPLGQTIIGTSGNDNLTGTAGDDTIEGRAGSDDITGGLGNDTVVFAEDFAGLSIVQVGSTYYISNGTDVDIVSGVENFSFNGHTVDVTANPDALDQTKGPAIDSIVEAGTDEDFTASTLQVSETAAVGAAVATVTASDPNLVAGDVLTFALVDGSGNPYTGPFSIAKTGYGTAAITVNGGLDFEAATSHGFSVKVTDAHGHSVTQALSVGVIEVNDAPVASPVTLTASNEDTQRIIMAAQLLAGVTDADTPPAGLSITSVTIASGGGTLTDNSNGTWTYTPAANHNGPVSFNYTVTDGVSSASSTASLDLTPVNDAPVIAYGMPAPFAENRSGVVYDAGATDVDAFGALTYALSGTDAAVFRINPTTGEITFAAAPDFENPLDAGHNNVYDIEVQVSDGSGGVDTQTIAVTVTDVNEASVITSNGGGNTAAISIAENTTAVTTVTAIDPDVGHTLSYSIIGGADASKFTIGSSTGALSFVTAPNFELPAAAGGNNVYDVIVQASDGQGGIDTQAISVTVTDVNEASVITGTSTAELTETNAAQSAGGTLSATDVDSSNAFVVQTDVAGSDGYGKFSINAGGVWTYTMNNAQNEFVGGTNYTGSITVATTDGTSQVITVTMHGTNDAAVITGTSMAELTETNAALTASGNLDASDVDSPATFVAQTGTVGAYGTFAINSAGVWTYTASSAHNEFVAGTTYTDTFTVVAADGTTKSVTVNILGSNDAPVIAYGMPAPFAENRSGVVYDAGATDVDAFGALTYALSGTDAAVFRINPTTGEITFAAAPDFENPLDAGHNNVYDIEVQVSDGSGGVDTQTIAVGVTNVSGRNFVGTNGNNTLVGTGEEDTISGRGGNDHLKGGAGNDWLNGGAGDDMIYGGAGNDRLTGGAGYDKFVFNTAISATSNVDTITDFNVVQDTIRLENAVMRGLGSHVGTLSSAAFWKSTSGLAHDGNDRIIYETDTGWLNYDSNGRAAGGAVHIAKLAPNLALTHADFFVI